MKRLTDLSRGELRIIALQGAIVTALNIDGGIIARPPADDICGWRHTLSHFAFAVGTGVVDSRKIRGAERAIINFDFVDHAGEKSWRGVVVLATDHDVDVRRD